MLEKYCDDNEYDKDYTAWNCAQFFCSSLDLTCLMFIN